LGVEEVSPPLPLRPDFCCVRRLPSALGSKVAPSKFTQKRQFFRFHVLLSLLHLPSHHLSTHLVRAGFEGCPVPPGGPACGGPVDSQKGYFFCLSLPFFICLCSAFRCAKAIGRGFFSSLRSPAPAHCALRFHSPCKTYSHRRPNFQPRKQRT